MLAAALTLSPWQNYWKVEVGLRDVDHLLDGVFGRGLKADLSNLYTRIHFLINARLIPWVYSNCR